MFRSDEIIDASENKIQQDKRADDNSEKFPPAERNQNMIHIRYCQIPIAPFADIEGPIRVHQPLMPLPRPRPITKLGSFNRLSFYSILHSLQNGISTKLRKHFLSLFHS